LFCWMWMIWAAHACLAHRPAGLPDNPHLKKTTPKKYSAYPVSNVLLERTLVSWYTHLMTAFNVFFSISQNLTP